MKSKDWLDRQKKDFYVKKAKNDGYLSRAAYKLIEIEEKYQLISKSNYILELGSAPGGWSQVISSVNSKALVSGFDILDMKFNYKNYKFFKEDFLNFDYSKLTNKFNLILSDIAPNTTGHKSTDHLRIISMLEDIISIIDNVSLPNSSCVLKIWKGNEEKNIINLLKKKYQKVSYFKPKSSRTESSEIFIVANKFIL